jgi:hypothetical protein
MQSLKLIIRNQNVFKKLRKALNANWDLTRDIPEELEYYRDLLKKTIKLNKEFIDSVKNEKR